MVIVPTFAESKQSDPKTVSGTVTGSKPPGSPHVRSRVDQPGGVQTNDRSEEYAPHQVWPAAQTQDDQPQCRNRNPMPFADPSMELTFAQIRNVRQEFLRLVVHCPAGNHPANMRPQAAIAGGVRITFFVCILMVQPMCGDPDDWTALQRQCAADGQNVFNPLRCFVSTMGEEPVVAHTDAEAYADPPQQNCERQRLPAEHKKRRYGSDVKNNHDQRCDPNDRLFECLVALKNCHHSHRYSI